MFVFVRFEESPLSLTHTLCVPTRLLRRFNGLFYPILFCEGNSKKEFLQ